MRERSSGVGDVTPTTPLLSYLTTSPLPTLVFRLRSDLSTAALLSNFALSQLTHGKDLFDCLSPTASAAFRNWSRAPRPPRHLSPIPPFPIAFDSHPGPPPNTDPGTADDDLELDLHLGNDDDKTARVMTVFWRRSFALDAGDELIIVTALAFPPRRLSRLSGSDALDSMKREVITVPKEERSVEERLRELELLTECSAVGLARVDLEGRVVWVNASWLEITEHEDGVPLAEWSRCLDTESYQKLLTDFKESRQGLVPFIGRFRLKSGKYVLAHCTPNSTDPTLVTGWISNLTDVTAQVQAEEAVTLLAREREKAALQAQAIETIEARRQDAEDQRKQQELLIDVTSHEIRNPISAILQNSELTRSSLLRIRTTLLGLTQSRLVPENFALETLAALDEDIEAIESTWECARAQERIANDILGLAQIGANRYSITPVPFSIVGSARTTLHMFLTECRAKGITLELALGSTLESLGPHVHVLADPVRLSQIIINLVANAVRFTATTPVRKVTLSIDVSATSPADDAPLVPPQGHSALPIPGGPLFVYFAVTDTGPGMTQEETQRVWERFSQATPLTHVTMGGSGLGLWIARSLCELHGGRIEVVSTPSVGSCFRGFISAGSSSALSLPDAPSSPTDFDSFDARMVGHQRMLHVLIVDDNAINRTILVRQLAQVGGFLVDTAKDGREAVGMVFAKGGGGYDCCLMDVEMPVLNGIAATREIREREAELGKRLRVVGCTGNARDGQLQAALESGMDDIVTKPYRLADLIQKLSLVTP